jgi:endonuclease/exonuclease/phosphatase (EEP) superfamily protein YafD
MTAFLGELWWVLELTSHFRLQYTAILSVTALLFALRREWKTAAVFGVFALSNIAVVVPNWTSDAIKSSPAAPRLRIVSLNVHTENQRFASVRSFLMESSPDVILLMEVNERWMTELSGLRHTYPYSIAQPQDDNFGIALFSRLPLKDPKLIFLGNSGVPTVTTRLEVGTNSILMFGIHTLPPVSPDYAQTRNEQLAELASLIRAQHGGLVTVIGDLNVTPWSPVFRRLVTDSGLRSSAQGRGVQASWPTAIFPLRIPLDHLLVSPGLGVADRHVGPNVGSDHFPIMAVLTIE